MAEYQIKRLRLGQGRGEWPEAQKCCWHQTAPMVFVYEEISWKRIFTDEVQWRFSEWPLKSVSLQVIDAKSEFEIVSELHIPYENAFGALVSLEHHPQLPFILIVWEFHVQIWDYEKRRIAGIRALSRRVNSGTFRAKSNQVCFTMQVSRGHGLNLAIWDYWNDRYQEFDLLNYDYAVVACLHPSEDLLIVSAGANDCDWEVCQAFFHFLGQQNELSFIPKSIAGQNGFLKNLHFSPDGRRLATLVEERIERDPHQCYVWLYDVLSESPSSIIFEGDLEGQDNLLFIEGGERLAFSQKNQVKIISIDSTFIEEIKCHTPVKHLSTSLIRGQLAITHESGWLTVASRDYEFSDNQRQSWQEQAQSVAADILATNRGKMRAVSEGIKAEDFERNESSKTAA